MKPMIRVVVAFAIALGALETSWAQAAPYLGTWMVDVQNSKRPRAMVISQQGDALRARWGFQDSGSKIGLATAAIDDAGALTLTTNSDSVVVLRIVDENTLKGTFTPRDGKRSAVTAMRSTAEALAAFNSPSTGSTTAAAAPIAPAAPTPVAAPTPATPSTSAAPAALASAASATTRTFLVRAEVEPLAAGKKWSFRRADSGSDVRWDLREGGALYGNNYSTNQKDSGTWSINEQGHLCTKWRGGSTDRCMALIREGDKLKMVDAATPGGPSANLAVE